MGLAIIEQTTGRNVDIKISVEVCVNLLSVIHGWVDLRLLLYLLPATSLSCLSEGHLFTYCRTLHTHCSGGCFHLLLWQFGEGEH